LVVMTLWMSFESLLAEPRQRIVPARKEERNKVLSTELSSLPLISLVCCG
jgi:hypothetical protein